jgi:hypothetical protein
MTDAAQGAPDSDSVDEITVTVSSQARNGEIRYRLKFPQDLHQLGLAGPTDMGEFDLPGLADEYGPDQKVFAIQSSRMITFCLPRGRFPDSLYLLLADTMRYHLGIPQLGLKAVHVCRHCDHDGTRIFWSYPPED